MAETLVEDLQLKPHPEGGFYRQTYHASKTIQAHGDKRYLATSIYYYLNSDDYSAWHRLKSDEMWHYYAGDGLTLHIIDDRGELTHIRMGNPSKNSELVAQALIPAGHWFSAEVECDNTYVLMGCTVSPGFDFADLEVGRCEALLAEFPQHNDILCRLTRE